MFEHAVTQVVQQAMLIHQNSTDIQTSGQNILAKVEQEKCQDIGKYLASAWHFLSFMIEESFLVNDVQ